MSCGSWFKFGPFGWDQLEFRDTKEGAVSDSNAGGENSSSQQTMGTGSAFHAVETFYSSTRVAITSTLYHSGGCPPCPHQSNTTPSCKSRPCDESDDAILEAWKSSHPQDYKVWNTSEDASKDMGKCDPGTSYSSARCPLCRQKYTIAPVHFHRDPFFMRSAYMHSLPQGYHNVGVTSVRDSHSRQTRPRANTHLPGSLRPQRRGS